MKLYFGNTVSTVTTLMVILMYAGIGYSVYNRANIQFWGRRTLVLAIYGLVMCCFAAARDGFDKTVQNAIDGSCARGIFSLISVPIVAAYIGAAAIVLSGIATLFSKNQQFREICFYIMSGGVTLKVMAIELARIIHIR